MSANYYPPVELDSESKYGLGLIGFYSYNSIVNVDHNNNRFVYINYKTEKERECFIPPGSYEIEALNDYIQQHIIKAGDGLSNTEENERQWDKTFCLKANTNTLKCELWSIHSIDFTRSDTPARLLGFSPAVYQHDIKHESDLNVEIMPHRIVCVDCNIVSGAYLNDNEAHTLYEYDIDAEPGYKLTKEPRNIIYLPITKRDSIENITLRVTDEYGSLLDFGGEEIIIRLELKKLI